MTVTTPSSTSASDAMIIARLVTELRCYLPERADPAWARLRHLGARRAGLVRDAGAARQPIRDLLECAWPAALRAAAQPLLDWDRRCLHAHIRAAGTAGLGYERRRPAARHPGCHRDAIAWCKGGDWRRRIARVVAQVRNV